MKATSLQIVETLKKAGHTAYLAGGCVRDMLLGILPKDFDIATSATPEEIEKLLKKTVPVGKDFGVMLAIKNGHSFEIATFRSDSDQSDGRRPKEVHFSTAEVDAQRRDFTINALFFDPTNEEIIDYVEGQKDLENKLVRFIGDPEKRIKEDHLRLLRAVRFKNVYGFQYHPQTYSAIKSGAHLIKDISSERIADELNKIIISPNAGQAFEELYEVGLLQHIIPELCLLKGLAQPLQYHTEGDVWDHSLMALKALTEEAPEDHLQSQEPIENPFFVEITLALRWATLLHDIGKYDTFQIDAERIRYNQHAEVGSEIAKKILRRLKFPLKITNRVCWLIHHHMMVFDIQKMNDSARRRWFLKPEFAELLELARADAMGTIPVNLDSYNEVKKLFHHEIATLKLLPKTLLTGEEIMELLHLKPSPKVGEILEEVREQQLAYKLKTKAQAKKYVLHQFLSA